MTQLDNRVDLMAPKRLNVLGFLRLYIVKCMLKRTRLGKWGGRL